MPSLIHDCLAIQTHAVRHLDSEIDQHRIGAQIKTLTRPAWLADCTDSLRLADLAEAIALGKDFAFAARFTAGLT